MTQFVRTTYLEIGFEEAGTADRPVAVLLHGWPDDVHCWDGVLPSLTDRYRLLMPHLRGHGATTFREKETPRSGQTAALAHDLLEFVRGLSQSCPTSRSPTWDFDGEEFDEAAEAWDNSDFAEVTANAYLQRWGEQPGSLEYDELDKQLAEQPGIAVPTMVLHGEQDRGDLPQTTADQERHFSAGYERRLLPGVGHFVPREAPAHTAAAIRDHDSG